MAGFRPVSQPEPLDMPLPFLPWAAVVIVSPRSSDFPGCQINSSGSNPSHASSNKLSDILEKRNLETFLE